MKKIISLFLAALTVFILAVPCFGASTVQFEVKFVSEDNGKAEITLDYAGGSSFCALDFEIKFNDKKLKCDSAVSGDGVDAFAKYVQKSGGAILTPMMNATSNPVKGSMASTIPFKAVNGRDICIVTFKKLGKEKISADDISVTITNCTTEDGTVLKTSVKNTMSTVTTSATAKITQTKATSVTSAKDKKTSASVSKSETTLSTVTSVTESSTDTKTTETTKPAEPQKNNTKKIVTVGAATLCMVFIIVAVCIYVVKKTKKQDGEAE